VKGKHIFTEDRGGKTCESLNLRLLPNYTKRTPAPATLDSQDSEAENFKLTTKTKVVSQRYSNFYYQDPTQRHQARDAEDSGGLSSNSKSGSESSGADDGDDGIRDDVSN